MISSMTGFGKGTNETEYGLYTVEIKSVNNRYLDINVKAPHNFLAFEDKIKKAIQNKVKRGKVDVFVNFKADADVFGGVIIVAEDDTATRGMNAFGNVYPGFVGHGKLLEALCGNVKCFGMGCICSLYARESYARAFFCSVSDEKKRRGQNNYRKDEGKRSFHFRTP